MWTWDTPEEGHCDNCGKMPPATLMIHHGEDGDFHSCAWCALADGIIEDSDIERLKKKVLKAKIAYHREKIAELKEKLSEL